MVVDHEERRRRIAEVTIEVIAREGLAAATIRRIAAELQLSTTAITYYFSDKRALLLWSYQMLAREGDDSLDEAIARDRADVVEALLTMVPWQPRNAIRWRVYLSFLDEAARDPVLAEEHRRGTRAGLDGIARVLRSAAPDLADVAGASRLLNAIIQGLALQIMTDPGAPTVAEVRAILQAAVDLVRRGETLAMSGQPA